MGLDPKIDTAEAGFQGLRGAKRKRGNVSQLPAARPKSLSRAVVTNRGAFFQRRLDLLALLGAHRCELESVLCPQCANNFCRDRLFIAVRQWDFERYGLAQYQTFSNECPQTTFAKIPRPARQAESRAVPLEKNLNRCLEHMPR